MRIPMGCSRRVREQAGPDAPPACRVRSMDGMVVECPVRPHPRNRGKAPQQVGIGGRGALGRGSTQATRRRKEYMMVAVVVTAF